jgi:hypothetical protein
MPNSHHVHPVDLMRPDVLSEIILIVGTVILAGLLFALARILYSLPSVLINWLSTGPS